MAKYTCIFEDTGSVDRYSSLRTIPDTLLSNIGRLCCRLGFDYKDELCILDAGAGTGRFVLPCAHVAQESGLHANILAVDLSARMLEQLQNNWDNTNVSLMLKCIQADLQDPLPIPKDSVHVAYTVATFHILDKWRQALDNLIQVIVPGGHLVFICENNQFMHQTEGFEKDCDFAVIDSILRKFMKYYHKLRKELGESYVPSELRYSDMMLAIKYLRESGLKEIDSGMPSDQLSWDKPHTYKDILHCFRNRQMTTWGSDLSNSARAVIADKLGTWVKEQAIDIEKKFLLPTCLVPYVFKKPGAK